MSDAHFIPRTALLDENSQEILKNEMLPLWEQGLHADEIAENLGFGLDGPYERLRPFHVYIYRKRFDFPPRIIKPHGTKKHPLSRYRVKPDQIIPPTAEGVLNKLNSEPTFQLMRNKAGDISPDSMMRRTYIWALFNGPLRVSEWTSIGISDIKIDKKEETISFDVWRLKKIHPKMVPFKIGFEFPGGREILAWINYQKGRENNRDAMLFPFSRYTALRIVKKLDPDLYNHWFRFDFVTKMVDRRVKPAKIKAVVAISYGMIDKYFMGREVDRDEEFEERRKLNATKE